MRYNFYRCVTDGCGSIATAKSMSEHGKCRICGGRKFKTANWHGWNLPKPIEWFYVLLGLR